ncbi:MAG: chemotaxis protein CheW, partial [Acetobacterium sp.]|nr:chemotaxis protein CheW [Acetobacterium sp.]
GIETHHVKEIYRNPEITEIPLAPPTVAGMINLRGQVVTLLDFEKLLGCPTAGQKNHCIVLKKEPAESDLIALLVQKAIDVIDVDETICEVPPPYLENQYGKTIQCIAKLEQALLIIIDKEKLF